MDPRRPVGFYIHEVKDEVNYEVIQGNIGLRVNRHPR